MARGNGINGAEENGAFNFQNFSAFVPDLSAVMEVHRRNAEVFTQASQQAFQDLQALLQRQSEMIRENWEETTQLFGRIMGQGSPQEKMAGQAELARNAIEKAVSNGKELVEMATSCQMRAAEMVAGRMGEAFEEFRSACARK